MRKKRQDLVRDPIGLISVVSTETLQDGKNTITRSSELLTDHPDPTPPFDLYTLEDELKLGVELERVNTKVLTPTRIDSSMVNRLVKTSKDVSKDASIDVPTDVPTDAPSNVPTDAPADTSKQ